MYLMLSGSLKRPLRDGFTSQVEVDGVFDDIPSPSFPTVVHVPGSAAGNFSHDPVRGPNDFLIERDVHKRKSALNQSIKKMVHGATEFYFDRRFCCFSWRFSRFLSSISLLIADHRQES